MKGNIKLAVLSAVIALSLSACRVYEIRSMEVTDDVYVAKSMHDVVYLEIVDKPHEIIGYVTVNAERNQRLSKVLEQIEKEAAILGGDAITNIRTNGGTGKWAQIKPQELLGNANVRSNFIATVIAFK